MNRQLARNVKERDSGRCEYCRIPQSIFPAPFQIDHVIAEKHGGETIPENLALACPHCNLYKGPNIAGVDAVSGRLVRLFQPRIDLWRNHFQFDGPLLLDRTPIGRITIQVLAMNADDLLLFRLTLLAEGLVL